MQKPSGKSSSLGSRKTKKASEAKAVDEIRASGRHALAAADTHRPLEGVWISFRM